MRFHVNENIQIAVRTALLARPTLAGMAQAITRINPGRDFNTECFFRFNPPYPMTGRARIFDYLATPAAGYVNGVSLAVDGGRMQSI